ncbi:MAG TPA: ABC transporter permease, partial [Advenella sp.]|nr:ABC transporter permease [Advenella sp.]
MVVRFIILRLVQLIPVLLGITILAFLLLRVMPGDPATLLLGSRGTAEDIAKLQHQLGLDKPLVVQYFQFLLDCLKGDFGTSIAFRTSVGPLIFERLWVTLALVAYSTVIAIVLTIPLAFLAALRKNS